MGRNLGASEGAIGEKAAFGYCFLEKLGKFKTILNVGFGKVFLMGSVWGYAADYNLRTAELYAEFSWRLVF